MKLIIYFSKAIRLMSTQDLTALLEKARRHNGKAQISGLLLFQDGCFLQALEGPIAEVDMLFERIRRDERHHEVTKLYDQRITERSFGEWTMGFHHVEGHELENRPGYSPVLGENFEADQLDLKEEMTFNLLVLFKQYVRDENAR